MKAFGCWHNMKFCGVPVVFFIVYVHAQILGVGRRHADFDRFDGSCSMHNLPVVYKYEGIRTEGSKLFINISMNAREDISSTNLKMVINLKRCKSKENPDTCEDFQKLKVDNYCAVIVSGSGMWSTVFSSFEPKLKCPIRKGFYRLTNGKMDITAFLLFTTGEWYWKATSSVHEKTSNRTIICVHVEVHVSM